MGMGLGWGWGECWGKLGGGGGRGGWVVKIRSNMKAHTETPKGSSRLMLEPLLFYFIFILFLIFIHGVLYYIIFPC